MNNGLWQQYLCKEFVTNSRWKAIFQHCSNIYLHVHFQNMFQNQVCNSHRHLISFWPIPHTPVQQNRKAKKEYWKHFHLSGCTVGKNWWSIHIQLFLSPLRKTETKCFLTQAGLSPYPSIFSFSLGMNGWHQPPSQVTKAKILSAFPLINEGNMNCNQKQPWVTSSTTVTKNAIQCDKSEPSCLQRIHWRNENLL